MAHLPQVPLKRFSKIISKLPWQPYQFCEQRFKTDPIKQKRHKKLNNDFLAEFKYLLQLHTQLRNVILARYVFPPTIHFTIDVLLDRYKGV